MKITAIIGSLRPDSIHRHIFNEYKEMNKDLFELEEASYAGLPVYDGVEESHPVADEMQQKILNSDGIIFLTPEYNYSVPGGLKNAIDWISRCDPQPMSGKPSTIIGASPGNAGTARMQYHLRQIGVFMNLHFMNKPEAMIAQSFSKVEDGVITDESTRNFLRRHAEAFAEFVNSSNG